MPGLRKCPAVGVLVQVDWIDITATINADLADATPAPCITFGKVAKKTDSFIVIATSLFCEPGETCGDFVAIPLGVIKRIKKI
tara:strand:- start:149 stop:397 length:249 start_codon:yes stop_codon:yes gene_type:complete